MRETRRNVQLTKARLAKGKTQRAMSTELGLCEQYIRHVEAGRFKPAIETALRISEYLGQSVEVLFAGVSDNRQSY